MPPRTRHRVAAVAAATAATLLLKSHLCSPEHSTEPREAHGSLQRSVSRIYNNTPPPSQGTLIQGQIRRPEGHILEAALVCATRLSSGNPGADNGSAQRCTLSDSHGVYRIVDLIPGSYYIGASAPGYIPNMYAASPAHPKGVPLTLAATVRATGIDVMLGRGGVLVEGVVLDISGGEIPDALVTADRVYTVTDDQGRFSFWAAPAPLRVSAHAHGYSAGLDEGLAGGHRFMIYLEPESVLAGKVLLSGEREPVVGAEVHAEGQGEAQGGVVTTDDRGRFRITGLRSGIYTLRAESDVAVGMAIEQVALGFGETREGILIEAQPALSVAGRFITNDAASCTSGSLLATNVQSKLEKRGVLDEHGVVRVRGLSPGTYTVQAHCEGTLPSEGPRELTLANESVTDLEWRVHPGGTIRGRIIASGDGVVPALQVFANQELNNPGTSASAVVQADGGFVLRGLLPGRYRVRALPARREPSTIQASVTVTLATDEELDGLEISLPASGEISGTARDTHGKGIPRLHVHASGDAGGTETWTDDAGNFKLTFVAPGLYTIFGTRQSEPLRTPDGSAVAQQEVEVSADRTESVSLVFAAADRQIDGRVVDITNSPLADVYVQAYPEFAGGGQERSYLDRPALTDADGRFAVTDLFPGSYTVRAYRRVGGESSVPHVETDRSIVISIGEPARISGTLRSINGAIPDAFSVDLLTPTKTVARSASFEHTAGRWSFVGVPAGHYRVRATAHAAAAWADITAEPDGENRVELVLRAEGTVDSP